MRWIREHKLFTAVLSVVIALLILIFSAYASGSGLNIGNGFRGVIAVVQKPFAYVGGGIKNAYNGIFNYKKLQEENEKLQEENEKLKKENNENAIRGDELARLEALYEYLQSEPFRESEAVAADIIAVDNSLTVHEFTVDVGKNKGIEAGNMVVDYNGIVGIVSQVDNTTAKVSSVLDTSFKMSFIAKKNTDILGILKGDGDRLSGYLLNEKSNVTEGDILLTSGRGSLPKGIAIGKVSKVEFDNDKQLKVLEVKPTSQFKSMQKVAIIK